MRKSPPTYDTIDAGLRHSLRMKICPIEGAAEDHGLVMETSNMCDLYSEAILL